MRRPFIGPGFVALALGFGTWATQARAHAFAAPYALPVPFWMYAYGACAALVASFVIVGFFAMPSQAGSKTVTANQPRSSHPRRCTVPPVAVIILRAAALMLLVLCIASGVLGSSNPFVNVNMTLFWIVFALGLTYLTVVVGDIYSLCNPWLTLCSLLSRGLRMSFEGRVAYPTKLGSYPALLLYMAFIWIELFGHTTPKQLAFYLLGYTWLTLFLSWLYGAQAWFRHGEFFALFFRLLGMMAAVDYGRGPAGKVTARLRVPLSGLLKPQPMDGGLVLFILFMLASTAFDGAHETQPWSRLFWQGVYPWIEPAVAAASSQPYVLAARIYHRWQWLMLVLSPLIYFALYVSFIWISKHTSRTEHSAGALGRRFALSLLPIAFVYHLTHYYTLLPAQGIQLIKMVSDPLGLGWNLFGTAGTEIPPLFLRANVVWHSQVALILVGHIASVFIAHLEALRAFPDQRSAIASQIPMLVLMVILTAAGLWILSLPLASG